MRRLTMHGLALCASALVMSHAVEAYGSEKGAKSDGILAGPCLHLIDGTVELDLGGISGQRLLAGGGIGDLNTDFGGAVVDHLFQNWFWYRTGGDTREYALSNLVSGGGGAPTNHERLVYIEPTDDGATPGALLVELEYTLTDLSSSADTALLQIGFQLRNLTNSAMNVQFFAYNDFDLSGTFQNEVATIGGSDLHQQAVVDIVTADRARFIVSSTNQFAWAIDDFPVIRTLLTGPLPPDNLPNAGSPFGPADYTGAHQWGTLLAAPPNVGSTLVGSVVIVIDRATCDSDIAPVGGDGIVGINDFLKVLADWGVCP